jgi:hypothetical protein
MSKGNGRLLLWNLTAALSLAGATVAGPTTAGAQPNERPVPKLFGGGPSKGNPATPPIEPRRHAEIEVELAWLADSMTFPYFLEARIEGAALTVTGYVPNKTVRDHALRLARLHTAYTVSDALKEHPSLLVRTGKMAPAQLQSAAVAAVKEALPKQHAKIQAQCATDGMVTLSGSVTSLEEKLAASVALRRLYGCTSVQNLISFPGAPEGAQAAAPPPPSTAKTNPPPANSTAGSTSKGTAAQTGIPPKDALQGPTLVSEAAPRKDEPAKNPPANTGMAKTPPTKTSPGSATPPSAAATPPAAASAKTMPSGTAIAKLQKQVQEACPDVKNVKIEVTAAHKLQIDVTVRNDEQIATVAGKLYSMPELASYGEQLELHFTVGQ